MQRVNIEKLVNKALEKTETEHLINNTRNHLTEQANLLTIKLQERDILIEQVKAVETQLKYLNETIYKKDKELEHTLNLLVQDNCNLYKLTRTKTKEKQDLIDCVSVSQKYTAVIEVLEMLVNYFQYKLNENGHNVTFQQHDPLQYQVQLFQQQNNNNNTINKKQQRIFPSITLTEYYTIEEYDIIVLEYPFYVKLLEIHFGSEPANIDNNVVVNQIALFQYLQVTQNLINKTKRAILTERRNFLMNTTQEQPKSFGDVESIISEINLKLLELETEKFTLDSGRKVGLIIYFNMQFVQSSFELYTHFLSEYFGLILPERIESIINNINMINVNINEKWASSSSLLNDVDLSMVEKFTQAMVSLVLKYQNLFVCNTRCVNNLFTIPPLPLLIENAKKTIFETCTSITSTGKILTTHCKFCGEFVSSNNPLCYIYCKCTIMDCCIKCKIKEWLKYRLKYKEQQEMYSNLSICQGCKCSWNLYNISAIKSER